MGLFICLYKSKVLVHQEASEAYATKDTLKAIVCAHPEIDLPVPEAVATIRTTT